MFDKSHDLSSWRVAGKLFLVGQVAILKDVILKSLIGQIARISLPFLQLVYPSHQNKDLLFIQHIEVKIFEKFNHIGSAYFLLGMLVFSCAFNSERRILEKQESPQFFVFFHNCQSIINILPFFIRLKIQN